ncbi:PTS system, sucrose-specific IIBC component [Bacillus anthracis]|nr:PTS system, sucrose-specific IIBC component [Bacillus anthracis]
MNMKQIATQVLQNIGGKENIMRATHCATRLRLVLKDETKINASEIENIDEVKVLSQRPNNIKLFLELA